MHSVYFAVVPKDMAQDSEEARDYAVSMLNGENFAGGEGYFGGGKADWFVVGGRWSGLLSQANPEWKNIVAEAKRIQEEYGIDQIRGISYGDKVKQGNRDKASQEINDYAMRIMGVPFDRDSYNGAGYPDDAMILTKKLAKFLAEWAKPTEDTWGDGVEIFSQEEGEEPLTDESLAKYIGKWIVVIDYHM